MLDKILIKGKFKNLQEYLIEIEEILKSDDVAIIGDFRSLKALERNFQLAVDEVLDVNMYLIRELGLNTSDDFQSTFTILSESDILPNNFALRIAPAVGLRNALVHRYEKIDKDLFVRQVRKEYSDFVQYMRLIDNYIEKY